MVHECLGRSSKFWEQATYGVAIVDSAWGINLANILLKLKPKGFPIRQYIVN